MYFVYILQSVKTDRYYIGSCQNLITRFHEHQSGKNKSTASGRPWNMPYYEVFESRQLACARERAIKAKKSSVSIRRIIECCTTW